MRGGDYDGYAMGMGPYFEFLRDCDLIDEESPYCSLAKLESIFLAANVNATGAHTVPRFPPCPVPRSPLCPVPSAH